MRRPEDQAAMAAAVAAARHLLHLPKPGRRASGLPSPVLKFAWQRRQTYILELDIIGLTPGSPAGRAATYSAWVWRSFWLLSDVAGEEGRRLAIDESLKKGADDRENNHGQHLDCPSIPVSAHRRGPGGFWGLHFFRQAVGVQPIGSLATSARPGAPGSATSRTVPRRSASSSAGPRRTWRFLLRPPRAGCPH
jgi:hypothetical protein